MANIIKPKYSTTPSNVPDTSDLADGEFAINVVDGIIYQRVGGTVYEVANFMELVEGAGIEVDSTDPKQPIVGLDAAVQASLALADTAVQPPDLDDFQPLDTTLTQLSEATPSGGQAVYWTGSSPSVAPYNISAGGRALANTTAAANQVPYYTSAGAASTFTATAAGRNMLDMVNATGTVRRQTGFANWENAFLVDGTYTPTITGVTNVASSSSPEAQYMRVGDVVTVSGSVSIDPTAGGTTTFRISLPVASTFSSNGQCSGVIGNGSLTGTITANIANNVAQAQFAAASGTALLINFHFTYRIA